MISVQQAQEKIFETISPGRPCRVPLQEALKRIVAEEIRSLYDLPLFDNSAMDGYALHAGETTSASPQNPIWFSVVKKIQAGDAPRASLGAGEAMRIFTGAMVPTGADAVVKQEEVIQKEGNTIGVTGPLKRGENIRYQGEEIRTGAPLLVAGHQLFPAAIGLLASVGLKEVPVFSPPVVGIIVTGSEIVSKPSSLTPGKIFDSNSHTLSAALEGLRLSPQFTKCVPDTQGVLTPVLRTSLSDVDFLIVTGGVSVGEFDFVREAAGQVGIEEVFWKVKQRPGRPLFFGKAKGGEKFLFGLPGNPASALVCFYEYVRPALFKAMGARICFLPSLKARLLTPFRKKSGLTHFLKGSFTNGEVRVLEHQGSHMMGSFADANCLVVLPEEGEDWQKGEEVEIHLLPF